MNKLRSRAILAGAIAALLLPASGATARNIKAKPQPAACAAARAQGQILPGCPRPDRVTEPAQPSPPPSTGANATRGNSSRDQ